MTLNRALRLRKSSEFERVRQQGHSIASRLLILAWVPNKEARLHIGFVVSKRISKHAVVRNYIKRLLSEAIGAYLAELPTGWDIVVCARNPILLADLQALKKDMSTLLRRAKLLEPVQTSETSC